MAFRMMPCYGFAFLDWITYPNVGETFHIRINAGEDFFCGAEREKSPGLMDEDLHCRPWRVIVDTGGRGHRLVSGGQPCYSSVLLRHAGDCAELCLDFDTSGNLHMRNCSEVAARAWVFPHSSVLGQQNGSQMTHVGHAYSSSSLRIVGATQHDPMSSLLEQQNASQTTHAGHAYGSSVPRIIGAAQHDPMSSLPHAVGKIRAEGLCLAAVPLQAPDSDMNHAPSLVFSMLACYGFAFFDWATYPNADSTFHIRLNAGEDYFCGGTLGKCPGLMDEDLHCRPWKLAQDPEGHGQRLVSGGQPCYTSSPPCRLSDCQELCLDFDDSGKVAMGNCSKVPARKWVFPNANML